MIRIVRCLVLVALAACSDSPPDPDTGPPSLVAKLSIEPMSAPAGGTMTITLTITNSGPGAATFSVFEDGHSFNPFVQDGFGLTVWSANSGRTVSPARRDVILTTGQVYTTTITWGLTDSQGNPLAPGSYTLTSDLDAAPLLRGFTQISTSIAIKGSG